MANYFAQFDSPPPQKENYFSRFDSSAPESKESTLSDVPKPDGFWNTMKRETLAGNMVTGAQESFNNLQEVGNFVGRNLYGAKSSDAAERASHIATEKKLESEEGKGVGNWIARQAGDPLNYPLAEIGGTKAVKLASEAIPAVKEGAKTLAAGYGARNQEAIEGAIKGMEGEAQKHFSTMKGVGVTPEVATKVFDDIDKAVREEREIDPDLHADYVKTIERMKEKARGGMTLQQLHLQRQLLRDVETKNFLNNKPVASVARKAIDAMDEALETAKHTGGSAEGSAGVQGMQNGMAKWAQARKFETIANVIQRAQGDPNKIKSGFTTLLNNKKQMRGFTKEEKDAIRSASENTSAEGLMKMVGKFGFDISSARSGGNTLPWLAGFGAHMAGAGTPELGALAGIGTGAKYGQKLMARGKAENVLKAIENRKIDPYVPNTGTPLPNVVNQLNPPQVP